MTGRMALKRLTASDLTLFAFQFRTAPAGKQKAINMNKDVFIDLFFPALRTVPQKTRYPIDLYLYGPGLAGELNIQRKILLQEKNWRLNGELINNPDNNPDRFNILLPGDIAVMEFNIGPEPETLRIVLIAQGVDDDVQIHHALSIILGTNTMVEVSSAYLGEVVQGISLPSNHSIRGFILSNELESVALGSERATESLLTIPSRAPVSLDSLQRARESAGRIGLLGEQLVSDYFHSRLESGAIHGYHWTSYVDAISPFDFWYSIDGKERILVDAKTTSGIFDNPIHVSLSELRRAAIKLERYDIYRVYNASETTGFGLLVILEDIGEFAASILQTLNTLPAGVSSDGISFKPSLVVTHRIEPLELRLAEPKDE
ncbi:DUF3883 domain-containing protein [Candidatus Oscillochloris fontis]|uniref:DUF3883 domain-containing protein n=1 Tax=Candidatus Oscillochloris fontis TaxID=2496868 RepID=UPI00101C6EB3|nr:DUF3883 domain-containing protein [Candidatus Oscillochloris fontis]